MTGGRKIGGKWKFSEARKRKNAARYWSIDTLLRRLRCLPESSGRKNRSENRSGRILLGVKETPSARGKSTGFLNAVLPRLFEFHDFCRTARFLETWGKAKSDRRSGKGVISTKIEDYLGEFWNAKQRDLYILTGIKRGFTRLALSFFSFHLDVFFSPLLFARNYMYTCRRMRKD